MTAPIRRAILSATAASAALAATAGAIPAHAAPDPVLELAANWHRTYAELGEAMNRTSLAVTEAQEEAAEAAQAEVAEMNHQAAVALAQTAPTTLAGLAAKARVAARYFGIEFPEAGLPPPDPECIDVAFALAMVADAERLAAEPSRS